MASVIRSGFGALSEINDLLIRLPESREIKERIVYFGGDIQDVERSMRSTSKRDFLHWSLEATAEIFARKFGRHALVVAVRPSEFYLDSFSVFRNFFACDAHSNPIYSTNTDKAWRQLDRIMGQVRVEVEKVSNISVVGSSWGDLPISLIGFSKGCAVLNQLLHEFVHVNDQSVEKRGELKTPSAVEKIYWLDGGHNGDSDTWITDRTILEAFYEYNKNSSLQLFVHATPYQMEDSRRPHIKRHKLAFCEILKSLGMMLHDQIHFRDQKRSLEIHFEVLTSF